MTWHNRTRALERKPTANRRIVVVVGACITAVLLIVATAILVTTQPFATVADSSFEPSSLLRQSVNSSKVTVVCPRRLSLPDADNYGDEAYRQSEGDLSSHARFGAFQQVNDPKHYALRDTEIKAKTFAHGNDEHAVSVSSADTDRDAHVAQGRISGARSGSGIAGAVASWATTGDVQGLSASTCNVPSMRQHFFVPEVQVGISAKLNAVNPSSKATMIRIRIWSVDHGAKPVALLTGNTMIVPAHSDANFDISAAVLRSKGLFVEVTSLQTPVAAFVKVFRMKGLTAKGGDIITPLGAPSGDSILTALSHGNRATLYMRADQDTHVHMTWLKEDACVAWRTMALSAQHVVQVPIDSIEQGVRALRVMADKPIFAMLQLEQDGQGEQQDVALVTPSRLQGESALVTPVEAQETTLAIASYEDQVSSVRMDAYDADGTFLGSKVVQLTASKMLEMPLSDIHNKAVMLQIRSHAKIAFSAILGQSSLIKEKIAGIAHINAIALQPQQANVNVNNDPRIVR